MRHLINWLPKVLDCGTKTDMRPSTIYLGELTYPLSSEPGISQSEPFTYITADVGLNSEGLWEDALSLTEYDKMVIHLTMLFGKPFEVTGEGTQGEKTHSWKAGEADIRLSITDQFAFRCYLTISVEEEE